jgi:hypothetical protein
MKNTLAMPAAAGLLLAVNLHAAHATSARTFVSGLGVDNPNCSRSQPCQSFQAAHDATSPGGVIVVLDPCGACGGVTLNRSISIIDEGVPAGNLVSGGGTGITINGAGIDVTLRGLTVEGIDNVSGATGIRFVKGKSLTIDHCAVHNIAGNGIVFAPNTDATLYVNNSLVLGNALDGIVVAPTGDVRVTGTVTRTQLLNNGFGGLDLFGHNATGNILFAVTDTVAAHNGAPGSGGNFIAQTSAGSAGAIIGLNRSVSVSSPNVGVITAGPGAFIDTTQNLVMFNTNGVAGPAGSIFSWQDNDVVNSTIAASPLSHY